MRRVLLACAVLVLLAGAAILIITLRDEPSAGQDGTVTREVTVQNDARSFPALLGRPRSSSAAPLPVVAFGHGFLQKPAAYGPLFETVAAAGYIVVAPNTHTGLTPDPSDLATELTQAIAWVRRTEPDADPRREAVAGYSMGGGAAIEALGRSPRVDVAVVVAPAQMADAVGGARRSRQPVAMIVGSDDRITPAEVTGRIFDAHAGPTRRFTVTGGSHCGFVGTVGMTGIPCGFGRIPPERQMMITNGLVRDLLDQHLRNGPPPVVPEGVVTDTG